MVMRPPEKGAQRDSTYLEHCWRSGQGEMIRERRLKGDAYTMTAQEAVFCGRSRAKPATPAGRAGPGGWNNDIRHRAPFQRQLRHAIDVQRDCA